LPAVNTPQFDWIRNLLPRRGRPVAPVFQPELAADAVVWAAGHRRREVDVAFSTTKAIVGQKLAPAVADRVLARTGFDAQQDPELDARDRPEDLWAPVAGDHGAHGRFDDEARRHSVEWWLDRHRRALAVAGTAALAAGIARRRRT